MRLNLLLRYVYTHMGIFIYKNISVTKKKKKKCQEHAKATLNVLNCWSIKSLQKNTEHNLG